MRGALRHLDVGGARTVVDVGGGFGHLAAALLEDHHDVIAIVLDLSDVIAIAERHLDALSADVRRRLTFVGGDMFVDVPAADLYVLRRIVQAGLVVTRVIGVDPRSGASIVDGVPRA